MSKKRKISGVQEDVSPNLIPMIDIMFLLLLFFMLGADMGQRELEDVFLPKAFAVKEDKEGKEDGGDKVVVNVYHDYDVDCPAYKASHSEEAETARQICRERAHWRIGVKGKNYDPKKLEKWLMIEGNIGRPPDKQMSQLSSGTQVTFSERAVMVRADQSAPYGLVQEVVNACAKVGIYKIECGAARPPDNEALDTRAGG